MHARHAHMLFSQSTWRWGCCARSSLLRLHLSWYSMVQPLLPGFGAVLADYARWLPDACRADAAALIAGAAA